MKNVSKLTIDGNTAAANIAYSFSEVAAIYPITPSSVMADNVDKFSCKNRKNIFGSKVDVVQMQSEAGAAGAIHGASSAGALATTFTSSQGLLLMIPNMYKIAGELMPCVIHVAARTVATHALSIFGDHSDVYACRQTGFAMVCSNSVQEVVHLAAISHLSSIKSSIPFLHFFDGFRTSHEIQKVEIPSDEDLKEMVDFEALEKFRKKALCPSHPVVRGSAENDDVYFQHIEASNIYYSKVADIVNEYMQKINQKYNTSYEPFECYGDSDAENIIIAMGSVCETIEEVIDYLRKKGKKVGLIKVRLYRPFSDKYLLKAINYFKNLKKITVLDRTKEKGSSAEPLYLDIVSVLKNFNFEIYSGRYGLSSKNTSSNHIIAVFDNMNANNSKKFFTVGIKDDVTNLSLEIKSNVITTPKEIFSCKFYGIGSDGTVGSSKNIIKMIGDKTNLNVQGFFSYDSKKSGGLTISHLRFGEKPIKSTYFVENADFIACHNSNYIYKYDILKDLKVGGKFLLNCVWNEDNLEKMLPNDFKKTLYNKNIEFYILNANEISEKIGLGGRINTPLQAAFFKINKIFGIEKYIKYMSEYIEKTYIKKGQNVVDMNIRSVEYGIKNLKKINIPKSWVNLENEECKNSNLEFKNGEIKKFVENIANPISLIKGNDLPVSSFVDYADGSLPLGSSTYEKRNISNIIPIWKPENCIQCNLCSYVCPHACIRPTALSEKEISEIPYDFKHKKMLGLPNLEFSISVSAKDCTGCGNCVEVCPGMKKNKALEMKNIENKDDMQKTFDKLQKIDLKNEVLEKFKDSTVKGSQFKKPLLEFSGACAGCGETPYAKLTTQLFGDKMIIANATGCSSIWGASFPSTVYTTDKNGFGPAWHNSLFEDNAEFGYGISIATKHKRNYLKEKIIETLNYTKDEYLKSLCNDYLESFENTDKNKIDSEKLIKYLENSNNIDILPKTKDLLIKNKNDIYKKSIWIFGGDGWAYDIGFGGLDHVISSGENVNILVFDTEVYSNTGGQASKSTPIGATAQFAFTGKTTPKKNLAAFAMNYSNVYVAQVALGANYNQCVKIFKQAESFSGPSIIIAYCPCINHGIKGGMKNSLNSALCAVNSGYFNLFDFDPRRENKLHIETVKQDLTINDFVNLETRFTFVKNTFPKNFENLSKKLEEDIESKMEKLKNLEK